MPHPLTALTMPYTTSRCDGRQWQQRRWQIQYHTMSIMPCTRCKGRWQHNKGGGSATKGGENAMPHDTSYQQYNNTWLQFNGSKKKWKKLVVSTRRFSRGGGVGKVIFLNFPTYQIFNIGTQVTVTPFPEADVAPATS